LNKVVATFEKHIFLSQTDLTRTGIIKTFTPQITKYGIDIQIVRPEMTKFKMFREKVNMDFYFVGITFQNTGR
jgi:hydrogenase maturation factor